MPKRASTEIFATRISGQPGLAERLLDLVGSIPAPRETKAPDPEARARALARAAAVRSASTAGALALPPGPLGWLTIAPELYAVWKVQAQLVADIAGAYGKRRLLTREQMLYCLFGHTAAGAFRNLVIRVGERYVIRRAPLSALYAIANKIAIRIAQRSAGRIVTRWVPALGALGVAGYVYLDTGKVADASIELFASDVKIEGELEVEGVDELAAATGSTPAASSARKTVTSKTTSPRKATPRREAGARAAPAKRGTGTRAAPAKRGTGTRAAPAKRGTGAKPAPAKGGARKPSSRSATRQARTTP